MNPITVSRQGDASAVLALALAMNMVLVACDGGANAQFDAYGSSSPVFADADADAFVLKASALASYYNGIEVAPGVTVNGENVVTEAAADLCGMQAVLEIAGKTQDTDYEEFINVWGPNATEVLSEAVSRLGKRGRLPS